MKKLKVTVDGKVYHVTVEILDDGTGLPSAAPSAPLAAAVPPPPAPSVPVPTLVSAAGATGDIKSPLAGKVVSIDVQAGQAVNEGQQVMTLEAMKMNTYIFAPKSGTVSEIFVRPGDAVDDGARLMVVA